MLFHIHVPSEIDVVVIGICRHCVRSEFFFHVDTKVVFHVIMSLA